MKIGLLVPEFPPQTIGGGGAVFEALAAAFREEQHEVVVVTSRIMVGDNTLGVLRLPEFPAPAPAFRTYMPPSGPGMSVAIAALRRCDVVNAHGYGFALVDLVALGIDPNRIVFTLHGFPYTAPRSGIWLRSAYGAYDRLLGARLLRRARNVTAVSAHVAQQACERGREDVIVINNGIALEPCADVVRATDLTILCVGRLEPLKGWRTVLDATAILMSRFPAVSVRFVGGDNGDGAALRLRASDLGIASRVAFLGAMDRSALAAEYGRASVLVSASLTEAFPAVPLEAMLCGLPCVLSDIPGNHEAAGDAALYYPPGDAARLAQALERLFEKEDLRSQLVAAGTANVRTRDWRSVGRRYLDVFTGSTR